MTASPATFHRTPWHNDLVQFARLLDEANAADAFTPQVTADLTASMDLAPEQIAELLARAQAAWETAKASSRVTTAAPAPIVLTARVTVDVAALSAETGLAPDYIPKFVQRLAESGARGYDCVTFSWDTPAAEPAEER